MWLLLYKLASLANIIEQVEWEAHKSLSMSAGSTLGANANALIKN